MEGRIFKVMLSSTFLDLIAEREAARDAILGQEMLPLLMEVSPPMPDRGIITNSLDMLDIPLVAQRYCRGFPTRRGPNFAVIVTRPVGKALEARSH